ncbi:hypothetical protein LOK49_LG11G00385 [Camellia lanceoleosa]|uniref:Uncharacterized protein n=1 Tax=Camellia lanceoleosa TaxID=1840588 RepID=A0ACC0G379_9ERIC|nr:hypothetical protein LOK49_LG11G00385 [Camellia lanceoleosa]
MVSGSCVGRTGKRSASASWSQQAGQTSTRKAPKRQSRLPYKKQRVSVTVGKNAAAGTSKAMYRSNISGVINTVLELEFGEGHLGKIRKTPFAAMLHCDKLVGTIRECHMVKHEPVLIDKNEGGKNVMNVDPVTDGGNVDPSFNCWRSDSAEDCHVRTDNNVTPTSKEKVIDAYGAMLTDMHRTVSGTREYQGTAYVYSSVCAVPDTLYTQYHANHWTVMVHDSDSGDWKHYNSLRPRRGVRDEHYNEALKVKQWVTEHHNNFVKPRIGIHDVKAEDFNGKLTSVIDCPQQAPESSDCGIFVCFIVRQHIRGADVNNTMDGLTPTTMRAAMVEMFLSSPEKGLHALAAQNMINTPFFSRNHTP